MKRLILIAVAAAIMTATSTTAHASSSCMFCGIAKGIDVTTIWWNPPPVLNSGGTDCDNHGGVKDAFTKEIRENGIDYLIIGVECKDGTQFIYEKVMIGAANFYGALLPLIILRYEDPTPPPTNWWDGWDGDCNNPPIDPTGQEVWSWC